MTDAKGKKKTPGDEEEAGAGPEDPEASGVQPGTSPGESGDSAESEPAKPGAKPGARLAAGVS